MAQPVEEVNFPGLHGEENANVYNNANASNNLDWIALEPINLMFEFVHDALDAFNVVEDRAKDAPASGSILIPHKSRRICSPTQKSAF